jgi:hypothetical protein
MFVRVALHVSGDNCGWVTDMHKHVISTHSSPTLVWIYFTSQINPDEQARLYSYQPPNTIFQGKTIPEEHGIPRSILTPLVVVATILVLRLLMKPDIVVSFEKLLRSTSTGSQANKWAVGHLDY